MRAGHWPASFQPLTAHHRGGPESTRFPIATCVRPNPRLNRQVLCTSLQLESNRIIFLASSACRGWVRVRMSYGFLGSLLEGSYMKWASWINFILGLWLIVAAFGVSHAQ